MLKAFSGKLKGGIPGKDGTKQREPGAKFYYRTYFLLSPFIVMMIEYISIAYNTQSYSFTSCVAPKAKLEQFQFFLPKGIDRLNPELVGINLTGTGIV